MLHRRVLLVMAGRAKVFFSDFLEGHFLKEPYIRYECPDFLKEPYIRYECPNCSERMINVKHQRNDLKQLYYVTVKCNSCSFASLGHISYEATLSMGFSNLISHVVAHLVSVDLIAQTERELEEEEYGLPF